MSQGNVRVGMVRIVAPEDVEIGVRFFSWVPAKGHLYTAMTNLAKAIEDNYLRV